MKILGIHATGSQSAAALLVNGVLECAAAEERFNRIKLCRDFPQQAIKFCLAQAHVKALEDLDGIAVSWNPSLNMRNINLSGFTTWRRYDPEWLYIISNNLMSLAGKKAFNNGHCLTVQLSEKSRCPLYFVDHHLAHMSQAIFQSNFNRGMAAVIDEYGEFYSVTIAQFNGNKFKIIKQIAYPNSLGVFYAAMTEYLGFKPNSEEWKVMGAAAYGNPKRFSKKIERLIAWNEKEGEWVLDTRYIEHSNMKRAGYVNERLEKIIGVPLRSPGEEMTKNYFDLAAGLQFIFEKRLFQILTHYGKIANEKYLVASGGCFMNAVANGKILSHTPFKRIFVPYAAADNGAAIGAALYVWHYVHGKATPHLDMATPYLGPSYGDSELEVFLKKYKISYKKVTDITKFTANQLAQGSLIGWFQGKMEFGERALGNRSILADPRDYRNKERINAAVKYRENFRPFAPSVIEEKAPLYFKLPKGCRVPYMEQAYQAQREKKALIPAVVHVDGSARLQTVSKKLNPLFYDLLKEFEAITGVPVVLNTSFNLQSEPIVCSVQDAVRTFYTSGLDMLIIGHYVVTKS